MSNKLEAHFTIRLGTPYQIISVTQNIQSLLGIESKFFENSQSDLKSMIHPHDEDIASKIFANNLDTVYSSFNIRLRHVNGKICCCKGSFSKALDQKSENIIVELYLQDAKSLYQVQDSPPMLQNFNAMMENTDDYIYFKDRNHVFTGASQTLVSLTSPSEHWTDLLGLTDYDVFPESLADEYYHLEKQVFTGTEVAQEVQEIITTDGYKGWVDNRKYPIENDAGEIVGLFGIARDITDSYNKEKQINVLLSQQNKILENKLVGMVTIQHRKIKWANSAFQSMLGYDFEELLGLETKKLYANKKDYETIGAAYENIEHQCIMQNEFEFIRKDGRHVWLDMRGDIFRKDTNESLWIFVDVTEQKQAERDLRIAATAFESQEGMTVTDEHKTIIKVNAAFSQITGYPAVDVIGKTPQILQSGTHDENFYKKMWQTIAQTGRWEGEIKNKHKKGHHYLERLTITAVHNSKGEITNYVGTHTDITERKANEEKIEYLAFYDPLTQLPNRRLLTDRIQHALANIKRTGQESALLFIDIDHFKILNDNYGHNVGDMLVKQVSKRISACVREGDTVARLGGDEFIVILENLDKTAYEANKQTKFIAEKILSSLNQIYRLSELDYSCSSSIGATLFHKQQITVEELIKRADSAMYQAKQDGRNSLSFYKNK